MSKRDRTNMIERLGVWGIVTLSLAFTGCGTAENPAGPSVPELTVEDEAAAPLFAAAYRSRYALLQVNAMNDKPGPVDIEVEGWDVHGNQVVDLPMTWNANDNAFSTEQADISKKTRVLRFTFVNDAYGGPNAPDLDRNAFIDWFKVNHLLYEAEDFDRTGGDDLAYPGCGAANITDVNGTTATGADCGNEGDWVEYDLHPGNPVGKGKPKKKK